MQLFFIIFPIHRLENEQYGGQVDTCQANDLTCVISIILCSVLGHGAITGLTAETAGSGLVLVDFTFLLPSLRLLTVSSPHTVPHITHHVD